MKWRREFGADSLQESDIDQSLLDANIMHFNQEADVFGRPVAIVYVTNHDRRKFGQKDLRKFAVFQMERGIKLLPPGLESFSLIFDIANFGTKNMDLSFVQFLATTLEQYYPERLGILLLFNAPWVFNGFWKLVKPLLDENVATKIQFANGEEIFKLAAKEKLPKRLGGLLEDLPGPTLVSYGRSTGHRRGPSTSSDITSFIEDTLPLTSAALEVRLFFFLFPSFSSGSLRSL
jgi:hypothetical protein